MASDMREVRLPADLCEAAEKRFGERFGGLEAFLITALKELLRDEAGQMDRDEQRMIEERLKDLGYI
jgi:hypothetical protein